MASGCVGFLRDFALTFGSSWSSTARFVRKVSRIFQLVNGAGGGAASPVAKRPRWRRPAAPNKSFLATESPLGTSGCATGLLTMATGSLR